MLILRIVTAFSFFSHSAATVFVNPPRQGGIQPEEFYMRQATQKLEIIVLNFLTDSLVQCR